MNEEQTKMEKVRDFLTGNFIVISNPTASFLKERHEKKVKEYETLSGRLDQAKQMIAQLESQRCACEGAIRECIEQLVDVLSWPDPKSKEIEE